VTARGDLAWRWAPLLAAVAVAIAWRGGYTADGRGVVAALAGLAALAALAATPELAARAARHPIVTTLAALAAITALSAVWTRTAAAPALRDAAAVLALCAVFVAAASLPAPGGHAAALLVAALASAIVGLVATIATSDPLAFDICGSWRPAGPFEYPPALALVCAGALPAAMGLATDRRRAQAAAGALAGWLLVTTVILTANRSAVALTALAATLCVALAPRGRRVGPVVGAVAIAAAASALVLHGDLARAGDGARLLALLPAAAVALIPGARPGAYGRGRWTAVVAAVGILGTAAVVVGARATGCGGDTSHGRTGIWRAAIDTAAERPLRGYGAGAFLAATRARQLEERPVPTRFAHDLGLQEWVELGVAGLLAVLAWYAAVGWTLVREAAPANRGAWLLAPAVAAFPLANLLDWPWALTGAGALWALAAGGLVAGRLADRRARRG
jgi:O-antigen ligase